jgi:hypothetical protein
MGSGERGKKSRIGDVVGGVRDARVEAAQEGKDELRVLHGMADVAEGGSLGLQALAVCRDGGVALHHGVELVEEDGAWLLVGVEDPLDGHSEITGGQVGLVHARLRTESSTEPMI